VDPTGSWRGIGDGRPLGIAGSEASAEDEAFGGVGAAPEWTVVATSGIGDCRNRALDPRSAGRGACSRIAEYGRDGNEIQRVYPAAGAPDGPSEELGASSDSWRFRVQGDSGAFAGSTAEARAGPAGHTGPGGADSGRHTGGDCDSGLLFEPCPCLTNIPL